MERRDMEFTILDLAIFGKRQTFAAPDLTSNFCTAVRIYMYSF